MRFKSWFNEASDYVWDTYRKKLVVGNYFTTPADIRFTIRDPREGYDGKKFIDIENSSYNNPRLHDALKKLLELEPRIADYGLYFDGYMHQGTVAEFLHQGVEETLPPYVYTGTSAARYEKIKIEGLKPRAMTDSDPVHGAFNSPSIPDRVYLSITPGNTVRFAARDAARDKSNPLILKIQSSGLRENLLVPDEDSRSHSWEDSIHISGTFAYKGVIRPEFISPYMIIDRTAEEGWRKV